MPVTPFLIGQPFEPDVVRAMSVAFEDVCGLLNLKSRSDPQSEVVAKKIIELAQRGIRDPTVLRERAMQEFKRGG